MARATPPPSPRRPPPLARPQGRRTSLRTRALVALALVAALAAGYFLWFRDVGLFQVRDVTVRGVSTGDASAIRRALEEASRGMTILHVREDALRRAVSRYPVVAGLDADPGFPDRLEIVVRERPPAASVPAGRERRAVAADGTILEGVPAAGLARLDAGGEVRGGRVTDAGARAVLAVLGAAPAPLRSRLSGADVSPKRGITVSMRDGPLLVFGGPTGAGVKWAAASAALADRSTRGATYVDVRIPDRAVAGGLEATDEESEAEAETAPVPEEPAAPPEGPAPEDPPPAADPATAGDPAAVDAAPVPEAPGGQ